MKRTLLAVLFLIIGIGAHAQTPWQGFLPGRTAHYAVPPAGHFSFVEAVYEVARFDSSFSNGPSSFHIPMKTAGTTWWSYDLSPTYPATSIPEISWIGAIVRTDSTEEEYIPAQGGSIILRRNRVRVGDTTLVWSGGPGTLYGICVSKRSSNPLTVPDSLASIRLHHVDSTGQPGLLSGRTLELSHAHGWTQAINFYHLGVDTLYRRLTMLSGTPRYCAYPGPRGYYNYQPGDVLHSVGSAYQDMTAQCPGGSICGTGFRAQRTTRSHRRVIQRIASSVVDTLIWQDSTQIVCQVLYPPMSMPPPQVSLSVDTIRTLAGLTQDTAAFNAASFEWNPRHEGPAHMAPALVRYRAKLMRLAYHNQFWISHSGSQLTAAPFGAISGSGGGMGQGMCSSSSGFAYATASGDTLGTPDRFVGIRKTINQPHLLTISPNPTSGLISIQPKTGKPTTLDVIRADGAILQSSTITAQTQLSLTHLPVGLYAWRAVQGSQVQTGRIVKE